ncbi:MAG: sulfotransferase family protein [Arenimonas sp.]
MSVSSKTELPVGGQSSIVRPLIIVSSPRSGSTMFFEALANCPDLYTIGGESHHAIESIESLNPSSRNYDSNVLTENDCSPVVANMLVDNFYQNSRKHDGSRPAPMESIRLLEKTPKNALRIPFVRKLFPDASFIYLYRDPRHVISSMIDAWQSGRFQTYPQLPGWTGQPWSLLLVPGWRSLIGKPLHHIVAYQWATTSRLLLDALESIDPANVEKVRYETFVLHSQTEINRLCQIFGLDANSNLDSLPLSQHTLTPPHPDKWKRNADLIEEIWPMVEDQVLRVDNFMGNA